MYLRFKGHLIKRKYLSTEFLVVVSVSDVPVKVNNWSVDVSRNAKHFHLVVEAVASSEHVFS